MMIATMLAQLFCLSACQLGVSGIALRVAENIDILAHVYANAVHIA